MENKSTEIKPISSRKQTGRQTCVYDDKTETSITLSFMEGVDHDSIITIVASNKFGQISGVSMTVFNLLVLTKELIETLNSTKEKEAAEKKELNDFIKELFK